jgi:hypothetical protein
MLGGDTPMNRGAERAALDLQGQRAAEARSKAAQRGGGRWEINTPWGKINLPEGGFTESGGIFNAPQRPIGTRAIENGKDVYWSGADYGYQSKDSFETLKNKGTFRPIGTQALRNGQPVFWSGAKYGYQSKATHEQLKQQGKI